MKQSTVFLIFIFVFLWNSGFIGGEYGLPYAGPFTLLFWRYGVLAGVLGLYLVLRRRLNWPGWSTVAPTLLVGCLAHGVWLSCVLISLQYGVPAGIIALIVALQPLATGALSGKVVGEYTPLRRWIGLTVGFLGVIITVGARIEFKDTESVFAYLIPFGSAMAMTAASLIQRKLEVSNRLRRLPMNNTLFYQALATFAVLLIPAVWFENLSTRWEPEFIWTMIWLIFAVSLGAYVAMWHLVARMTATRVASLFYLGPPVTMLMAWVTFGDTVRIWDLAGLIVVAVGVFLGQSGVKREPGNQADGLRS
ncbi:EamA family transporter [candidate division KSB1 bacterium]|nr:EamA family transporter [candidate division KSB1 bacterium]